MNHIGDKTRIVHMRLPAGKAAVRFLATLGMTVVGLVFVVLFAHAQQPPPTGLPIGNVGIEGAADVPGQAGLLLTSTDPRIIVAKIIRVALGFLGTVALVLILYGGYLWMTAAGNEETIDKAKKVLTQATIGLAIILSAFSITQFIINRLLADLAAPPLPPPSGAPARVGGGGLGSGIVESHYPMRGKDNIPRNTRIIITFKEKIDPRSLAELVPGTPEGTEVFKKTPEGSFVYPTVQVDHDNNPATAALPVSALRLKRKDGISSAIQIIRTLDINDRVPESDGKKYLGSDDGDSNAQNDIDVLVSFTPDLRTFVLTPVERSARHRRALFGEATDDIGYSVYLCGTAPNSDNCAKGEGGIKLLTATNTTGESAFRGRFLDYGWSFTVGTFLDVKPPKIQSVIPAPDNVADVGTGNCPDTVHGAPCDRPDRPRNSMVQVNFDEAVLPTVSSGKMLIATTAGVTGERPTRGDGIEPGSLKTMPVKIPLKEGFDFIAGEWALGNQYKTAEFTSMEKCAQNSCGEDVFCLPGASNIVVQVLAASLAQQGDPSSAGQFDGIEDIAGNSLDGNGDGSAKGPITFFRMNIPAPTTNVPGDSAQFSFFTSLEILLGAPVLQSTKPTTTYSGITPGASLTEPIEIEFDRAIAMTTFSSSTLSLVGTDQKTDGFWDTWWTTEGENQADDATHTHGIGIGKVVHGGFWEETKYASKVSSKVRDLYQNCYYPSGGIGIQPGNMECTPTVAMPYCCNGVAQIGACGF
ncbi:MAG: pilin [bacterium]|nr:pilin [bacterium]